MSCLFDEDADDEVIDEALAWSRKLIVGAPFARPEDLNTFEEIYRREGVPPVLFEEDDGNGPYLGNAAEFGKAMGYAPGILPTLEQATAWLGTQRWPEWT